MIQNDQNNVISNEQVELNYYLGHFREEIRERSDFYEQTAKMIITFPLFVNAAAAIALVTFFSSENYQQISSIRWAEIIFVIGTAVGLLTLIFEYFFAYFCHHHFNNYLINFANYAETQQGALQELKKYYSNFSLRHQKIQTTIKLRIFNGGISMFFCFLGICFIV
jgi:hypothetical protein